MRLLARCAWLPLGLAWSCAEPPASPPAANLPPGAGRGASWPASADTTRRRASPVPVFVDVAVSSGLIFEHTNGAAGERFFPETMAGGGAFADFDRDGRLDVYVVNGAWLSQAPAGSPFPVNELFLNSGDGLFEHVPEAAGAGHDGFGMGCAAGDYDGDGDLDLFVTNYGPDILFRNDRSAENAWRFHPRPSAVPSVSRWGTSCAFADLDRDGDLDLYVANYVDYDHTQRPENAVPYSAAAAPSGPGAPKGYPHPGNFAGSPDFLYRNEGDGSFTDVSASAGVANANGKGLGVAIGDIDDDGWPDIYVANDAVPNFLYVNRADGTFDERAAIAGVAYGQDGQEEAGMGVDLGDYDGDGRLDLVVTNFQAEPNDLYHNEGGGFFSVETFSSGTGSVSLPYLGFGTHLLDFDNDGRLDLFVANGHVLDNVSLFDQSTSFEQRNLLFRNNGPGAFGRFTFEDVAPLAGQDMTSAGVSRGTATGDYDDDGDLDLLVVELGRQLALLRNEGPVGNWLQLELIGCVSNRDGIGARIELVADDRRQIRELRGGRSYLSHSDLRAHFGLGESSEVDSLVITWPSGTVDRLARVMANQRLAIAEGRGLGTGGRCR